MLKMELIVFVLVLLHLCVSGCYICALLVITVGRFGKEAQLSRSDALP